MKTKKISRATQILLSLGVVFTSGTLLFHSAFPMMPDFIRGALEGLGMGLIIVGLVKQRKEGRACAGARENIISEITDKECFK